MKSNLLRVSQHKITEEDKKAVLRALESGCVARGAGDVLHVCKPLREVLG